MRYAIKILKKEDCKCEYWETIRFERGFEKAKEETRRLQEKGYIARFSLSEK